VSSTLPTSAPVAQEDVAPPADPGADRDDRLLDYDAAAEFTSIPKATLYTWVCLDQIPHLRFGARTVRFRRRDLEAFGERRAADAAKRHRDPCRHCGGRGYEPL
jgi:excisionase family DNA binding protein